jgi:SAM-dependent methyltransferase
VDGRPAPALSFGSVASEYDRLRPPPVAGALEWIVPQGCQVAVDVAAGTGLVTRPLRERVPHVVAVEPDERMRAVLEARSQGVRVLAGAGEQLPLPDASADLVVVASAWHWLDPERAVPEFARVLRDGGCLALLWTSRERQEWFRELDLEQLGIRRDMPGRTREARHREVRLPDHAPFEGIELATFTGTRTMSKADLVALLGTYSQLIAADPDVRRRALEAARAALDRRFPGVDPVPVPMGTHCWRARRTAVSTG